MEIKKKPTAIVVAASLLAWELFLQPIWNLNLEKLAEKGDIDTTLSDGGEGVMSALRSAGDYLPDSFAIGFALGALIFAYWDFIAATFRRRFRKEGELADMRAWVGVITPTFEREKGTLRLWARAISVGDVAFRVAAVEGSVTIICDNGNGRKSPILLGNPRIEYDHEGFAERGYVCGFSLLVDVPDQFWKLTPDVFFWTPSPSLRLENLTVWLESRRGTRKKLRLWDSLRMTGGDGQVRSVETFGIAKA